jgi:CBS domain containing-hemolysin-like protein
MVHIKDVLISFDRDKPARLAELVREILFVAPSMRVLDLLLEMRQNRVHMAIIVDEFGGVDGLVTIEDLVEEIVGEIEDEHDEEEAPHLAPRPDGTLLADARTPVEEFEQVTGPVLDAEEREEVETLGGLIFRLVDRVPRRGEIISHPSGIEFEVLDADPRRVRRLRVRNLPANRAAEAGD